MLHPELILDAGRQRQKELLRDAMLYRAAQRMRANQSRTPAWIRWGVGDTLMSLGQRLRGEHGDA
jgi:hypothetical protein